jgi:predicted RNA-binding Zn-ribbon protein involved in translation (DUF1610 family)
MGQCRVCGAEMEIIPKEYRWVCPECGYTEPRRMRQGNDYY